MSPPAARRSSTSSVRTSFPGRFFGSAMMRLREARPPMTGAGRALTFGGWSAGHDTGEA